MLFSEANQDWMPTPPWVRFLIRLGFDWPAGNSGRRRIALVSMPCDSAAAGLIALGLIIRDLGSPYTTDVEGHYDALMRFARQYLDSCRKCTDRCHPELVNCGYAAEATGRVRNRAGKLYETSERTDFGARRLAVSMERKHLIWWPDPRQATDWRIDGEPPVQLNQSEGILKADAYRQIVEGAPILSRNLNTSYSGLCFAGRTAGESATFQVITSIKFRIGEVKYSLADLLTVQGWGQRNGISRMAFFNSRNEQFDRRTSAPSSVIADGHGSFLKILGHRGFQLSDVIGVVQRTVERAELELVGARMLGLRQWYSSGTAPAHVSALPRGISISILEKRNH